MISAVLVTFNDQRRLGETLAVLVPAFVDGLVRQVIIADLGSTDATLEIADDAGATIVTGDLRAGIAAAKEPWLLLLDPGARLAPGWDAVLRAHMAGEPRPGVIRLGPRRGLLSRIAPSPAAGLLIPRALVGEGVTLAELVRAAQKPATLDVQARVAV
jgi:glycosyltransferase involved in cell wall biosynthesis